MKTEKLQLNSELNRIKARIIFLREIKDGESAVLTLAEMQELLNLNTEAHRILKELKN